MIIDAPETHLAVRRQVAKFGTSPHDAQDLAQQALLHLYQTEMKQPG